MMKKNNLFLLILSLLALSILSCETVNNIYDCDPNQEDGGAGAPKILKRR
ncbi:hypothetical protein [Borrelia sp. P9F1]|nr:hypothetical protein [Borrelia sp. P9F1]WKC57888.1 hypothetical protein QYZ68_01635 [Borrelia sp. P9F1]